MQRPAGDPVPNRLETYLAWLKPPREEEIAVGIPASGTLAETPE